MQGNIIAPGFADPNPQGPPEDAVLYVGNLSPSTDEALIFQHFSAYGQLQNVSLKKNILGNSRHFGFVNFKTAEDARKAKEALNHTLVNDKELRICFKKDFKNLEQEANVYVKNLPSSVRAKQLEEEFAPYGPIFSCIVKYDEKGQSLGYGYVQFKDKESADKAIQAMNGSSNFGKDSKIDVQKFVPFGKRDIKSWKTNLYIKGFPSSWKKDKIDSFIDEKFKTIGHVTSVAVIENEKLGKFFAFVAYEKDEDAGKAMKTLNDAPMEGGEENLYVGYAQKKSFRRKKLAENFAAPTKRTNLYIKSLKESVTEQQLKDAFSVFGEVTSVMVQLSTKIPKSIEAQGVKVKFGFINFKDEECANKAYTDAKSNADIKALITEHHEEKKDFLGFAQPKSVREQYLKMTRKNMQVTSMMHSQMNMMKMLFMQMNKSRNGNNQRGRGNKGGQPQNMFPQGMDMSNISNNPMFQMFNMNMANNPMAFMNNQMYGGGIPAPMPQQAPIPPPQEPKVDSANQTEERDLTWLIQNKSTFEAMDPNEKRRLLGNLMYYRVSNQPIKKDLIPKITGMLIDLEVLDLSDIIEILTKDDVLNERIQDAISIINEADQ